MLSKKLVGTLGVLTATALAPAAVAHAATSPGPTEAARVLTLGTQVGSEGIRSPQADGIIAVLIAAVSSPAGEPPKGHLVQGREGGAHGCPYCPHPPPYVTTAPASIASDGLGSPTACAVPARPPATPLPRRSSSRPDRSIRTSPDPANEHGRHAGESDHAVAGS
jgi:hypothetical protein